MVPYFLLYASPILITAIMAVVFAFFWRRWVEKTELFYWCASYLLLFLAYLVCFLRESDIVQIRFAFTFEGACMTYSACLLFWGMQKRYSKVVNYWSLVVVAAIVVGFESYLYYQYSASMPLYMMVIAFYTSLLLAASALLISRKPGRRSAAETGAFALLLFYASAQFLGFLSAAMQSVTGNDVFGIGFVILVFLLVTPAVAGVGILMMLMVSEDVLAEAGDLAQRDMLTGAFNRRGFDRQVRRLIERSRRHGRPLSLALADIDHFKAVNDTHGHAVGDEVIRCFADRLCEQLRADDVFGRVGGEEFAVVLVDTDLSAAEPIVERLRQSVEQMRVPCNVSDLGITVSFGVARFAYDDDDATGPLGRADAALYRAKEAGRNQVKTEQSAGPRPGSEAALLQTVPQGA